MDTSLLTLLTVGALGFSLNYSAPGAIAPVSRVDAALEARAGGDGDSTGPLMTPDARFVLFASTANNLAIMTNGTAAPAPFPVFLNVFLHDRNKGTTALVSMNISGASGGNGDSLPVGISTNGRYAFFESSAANIVANDTNSANDIFLRDMQTGTTRLVSVSTNASVGNGPSRSATITPDGRFVAFVSAANDLVDGDTNGIADIFVRDLQSGTTVLASPGARAATPSYTSSSESPEISDDGHYVAFFSTATNVVNGVVTAGEIYVRDLVAETTLLASADAQATLLALTGSATAVSCNHALSADGNFVAFAVSPAENPFSGLILRYGIESHLIDVVHTNALMFAGPREHVRTLDITPDGQSIVFLANTPVDEHTVPSVLVWEATGQTTTVASRDLTNGIAAGDFEWPTIDSTGRFVCFTSTAQNLTTNQLNSLVHVYVRDLLLAATRLADANSNGVGFGVSSYTVPCLSEDAQSVAFHGLDPSTAGDSLRSQQVFVRDLSNAAVELVSTRHPDLAPATGNGSSVAAPSVSQDGRYVAFASFASNLVTNDINANRDVFVRDLRDGTTVLASVGTNGFAADGMSCEPSISADGRFVAFTSTANNLVPLDNNARRDVFVFDTHARSMVLCSASMSGGSGNNSSFAPRISADGLSLFFRSRATDLAGGSYTSSSENLFWRNLQMGTNVALTTSGVASEAVSQNGRFAAYQPLNSGSSFFLWDSLLEKRIYTNGLSMQNLIQAVSPDGNRVAYYSSGLSLVQRSPAASWQVSSQLTRVRFSADSDYLAYATPTAQGTTDTNGTFDVCLHHIPSRTSTLVSRALNLPDAANSASKFPDVSFDGRYVTYQSAATDLVANDNNGWPDVFLYDRLTGTTRILSVGESGSSADARSFPPIFSGDGRILVFPSWASDLTDGDLNQSGDLFAFRFLYATIVQSAGQAPVISWPATSGHNYQVQFKTHIDELNWQTLTGNIAITNGTASTRDESAGPDQRVYRVVEF